MKEAEAIFSSTGKLGVSRRPDERLYANATRFSSSSEEVDRNFQRLVTIGQRSDRVGRTIFRGVTSREVFDHVINSDSRQYLEAAVSLEEFTGDSSWLIYMASNKPGREQIVPVDIMIKETSGQRSSLSPSERIKEVKEKGYKFINTISEDQVDQIHALWGETFGWNRKEVDNLRRKIDAVNGAKEIERGVWFSGITDNGVIVSVCMAERLTIPSANGTLDLVESTEWRTKDGYEGQGLMTAALIMLNAQILSDYRSGPKRPLIYAECNFQSRSDRAGFGAGLRIPQRTHRGILIPQILIQNVSVADGILAGEKKLRDFTFMYLPTDIIQSDYDPVQVDAIMHILKQ